MHIIDGNGVYVCLEQNIKSDNEDDNNKNIRIESILMIQESENTIYDQA